MYEKYPICYSKLSSEILQNEKEVNNFFGYSQSRMCSSSIESNSSLGSTTFGFTSEPVWLSRNQDSFCSLHSQSPAASVIDSQFEDLTVRKRESKKHFAAEEQQYRTKAFQQQRSVFNISLTLDHGSPVSCGCWLLCSTSNCQMKAGPT